MKLCFCCTTVQKEGVVVVQESGSAVPEFGGHAAVAVPTQQTREL